MMLGDAASGFIAMSGSGANKVLWALAPNADPSQIIVTGTLYAFNPQNLSKLLFVVTRSVSSWPLTCSVSSSYLLCILLVSL